MPDSASLRSINGVKGADGRSFDRGHRTFDRALRMSLPDGFLVNLGLAVPIGPCHGNRGRARAMGRLP
jgi:hypothetical protein